MGMNKIQLEHLAHILDETQDLISNKYVKGAAEHKSILSEDYNAVELCDMAIEEAIDQITYLLTLRSKL
jgi:hypothetical protein